MRLISLRSRGPCILCSMMIFRHSRVPPPRNLTPIFHHDLQSACIFLDADFSVRPCCFDLQSQRFNSMRNNVRSFDLVLLEMIAVNTMQVNNSTTSILQKLKKGKVEEMVDPSLYYHEQPPYRREQIEIMTNLVMRCLMFGADGKLSIGDVARELVHMRW